MRSPTPKSLVLDLLSSRRGGALPVSVLVESAALFGIDGGALRVALARLLAAGRVMRDERGMYRIGEAAAAVDARVLRWRDAARRGCRWSGGYWMVGSLAVPRARTKPRVARERALRLLGFSALDPGLYLRPDNVGNDACALLSELRALGLEAEAWVAHVDALDHATAARARGLWDREALRRSYDEGLRALAQSEARLPRLSPAEAAAETFLLGGRVIRTLVLDPMLPEPLAPESQRRALAQAMLCYDRIGRAAWQTFVGNLVGDATLPPGAAPAHGERTLSLSPGLEAAS